MLKNKFKNEKRTNSSYPKFVSNCSAKKVIIESSDKTYLTNMKPQFTGKFERKYDTNFLAGKSGVPTSICLIILILFGQVFTLL